MSIERPLPPTNMTFFKSLLMLALIAAPVQVAGAQQPTSAGARGTASVQLSLDDALRIAQNQSQTVEVARAGVVRATGQQ